MMHAENVERAERLANVLKRTLYDHAREGDCAIVDAVTDVMHLCELIGIDFDEVIESARMHYEAEKLTTGIRSLMKERPGR